jgi:hypothetical protein
MNLVPAYGRDYKSKASVQADLDADLDFTIADISSPWNGRYVNKSQLVDAGYKQITVRYSRLRKVAVIDIQ